MSIAEVQIEWQGFGGAPGFSSLHFTYASNSPENGMLAAEAADNFAGAITGSLASGVSVTVSTEVKWFDEDDGTLERITAVDPVFASHTGSSGGLGPLASGAVVNWSTETLNRGRRVRGRTYLVPLAVVAYQSDGTLTTLVRGALQTAGLNLMADSDGAFCVWSRPRETAPGSGTFAGGKAAPVQTSNVPDMAAVLRSRRD